MRDSDAYARDPMGHEDARVFADSRYEADLNHIPELSPFLEVLCDLIVLTEYPLRGMQHPVVR